MTFLTRFMTIMMRALQSLSTTLIRRLGAGNEQQERTLQIGCICLATMFIALCGWGMMLILFLFVEPSVRENSLKLLGIAWDYSKYAGGLIVSAVSFSFAILKAYEKWFKAPRVKGDISYVMETGAGKRLHLENLKSQLIEKLKTFGADLQVNEHISYTSFKGTGKVFARLSMNERKQSLDLKCFLDPLEAAKYSSITNNKIQILENSSHGNLKIVITNSQDISFLEPVLSKCYLFCQLPNSGNKSSLPKSEQFSFPENYDIFQDSESRRYQYFIKSLIKENAAWGLYQDIWAIDELDDGTPVFPIWPSSSYAAKCSTDIWKDCDPKKIELEFLLTLVLPRLKKYGILLGVFPSSTDHGMVIELDKFAEDVEAARLKSKS